MPRYSQTDTQVQTHVLSTWMQVLPSQSEENVLRMITSKEHNVWFVALCEALEDFRCRIGGACISHLPECHRMAKALTNHIDVICNLCENTPHRARMCKILVTAVLRQPCHPLPRLPPTSRDDLPTERGDATLKNKPTKVRRHHNLDRPRVGSRCRKRAEFVDATESCVIADTAMPTFHHRRHISNQV